MLLLPLLAPLTSGHVTDGGTKTSATACVVNFNSGGFPSHTHTPSPPTHTTHAMGLLRSVLLPLAVVALLAATSAFGGCSGERGRDDALLRSGGAPPSCLLACAGRRQAGGWGGRGGLRGWSCMRRGGGAHRNLHSHQPHARLLQPHWLCAAEGVRHSSCCTHVHAQETRTLSATHLWQRVCDGGGAPAASHTTHARTHTHTYPSLLTPPFPPSSNSPTHLLLPQPATRTMTRRCPWTWPPSG